jgi:hypothetical protein
MKRAALRLAALYAFRLVVLFALCMSVALVPEIVLAQEDAFTAAAGAKLEGLSGLLREKCFPERSDKLRIALVEIDPKGKFETSTARTVATRIEAVLDNDSGFVVVRRRLYVEITELLRELQASRLMIQDIKLDAIITVDPDADDKGQTVLNVVAHASLACAFSTRAARGAIPLGDIRAPLDVPGKFFEDAAEKLPERDVERVVVMPAYIENLGILFADRRVEELREQLAGAIRRMFESRNRMHLGEGNVPPVGLYGSMDLSNAWQARLYLGRGRQQINVRVEFRGPDRQPRSDYGGHFASNSVSAHSDSKVLVVAAAKTPFRLHDRLDVKIAVLRPSHLFCFVLDADGEATLLYPTDETERDGNRFDRAHSEIHFPDGFKHPTFGYLPLGLGGPITLDRPIDEFFDCIVTRQPLQGELKTLWFKNTYSWLNRHHQKPAIGPDEISKILSGLRHSDGYDESIAEIVAE